MSAEQELWECVGSVLGAAWGGVVGLVVVLGRCVHFAERWLSGAVAGCDVDATVGRRRSAAGCCATRDKRVGDRDRGQPWWV